MKILLICPNELFYEPRLRKSAIYFMEKGHDVHVLCALTIKKDFDTYIQIKKNHPKITFHEIDLSKKNLSSKIIWMVSSILHLILDRTYKHFGLEIIKSKGILNKTLLLSKIPNDHFDIIYSNLIDTLPFAFHIKSKTSLNAKIIFDSQEFFTGQFSQDLPHKRKWVEKTEEKFINACYFVIGTTSAMVSALKDKYTLKNETFRVRNVPLKAEIPDSEFQNDSSHLKLIWHGKTINPGNKRGVHILIKAVLVAKCNCELYLQGKISNEDLEKIELLKKQFPSSNKIHIIKSAKPTQIVNSLVKYDVGLIGELPEELNQQYTSSNKLFDYIGAGLAIIAPEIIGLTETINEYKNGLLYSAGDFLELANNIETLTNNRALTKELKYNSIQAKTSCFWENDFDPVYKKLADLT